MTQPKHRGQRLNAFLLTLYLIFTTSYVSAYGGSRNLCIDDLYFIGLLDQLQPEHPKIEGALVPMLLTQPRNQSCVSNDAAMVPV
jgi:predicted RNA polymerase sigma factor